MAARRTRRFVGPLALTAAPQLLFTVPPGHHYLIWDIIGINAGGLVPTTIDVGLNDAAMAAASFVWQTSLAGNTTQSAPGQFTMEVGEQLFAKSGILGAINIVVSGMDYNLP